MDLSSLGTAVDPAGLGSSVQIRFISETCIYNFHCGAQAEEEVATWKKFFSCDGKEQAYHTLLMATNIPLAREGT